MWMAIAALAATAINAYNTNQTVKRQDRQAVAAIRNQRSQQERANGAISATVSQLEKSRAATAKENAGKRYLAALGRAGVGGQVTGALSGGGSQAYRDAMSTAAANEGSYATNLADLYAATDAPVDQRLGESFAIGDLGTELGTIGSISRGQAGIDQLRYNSIRRNPYLDLTAQALQGFAGGGGGGVTSSLNRRYSPGVG